MLFHYEINGKVNYYLTNKPCEYICSIYISIQFVLVNNKVDSSYENTRILNLSEVLTNLIKLFFTLCSH